MHALLRYNVPHEVKNLIAKKTSQIMKYGCNNPKWTDVIIQIRQIMQQ